MASSSKPTGVHYALVFFVLATIVCGLGWILAYKGAGSLGEMRDQLAKQKKTADDATKAATTALDQITKMKNGIGSKFEQVGDDDSNPNTVLGDIKQHIVNYGPGLAAPSLHELVVKQFEALRNTTQARDKLQEQLTAELALFQQKTDELNKQLDEQKKAREMADKGKTDADTTHKEELDKKDSDIADLKKAYADATAEHDEYKEATDKKIKELDTRINNLLTLNNTLRKTLDEKTRPSFEIADGEVRWVDAASQKVWINLGEADGLKPRTTFSVYKKTHSGVGRGGGPGAKGPEDIKGAIEVTRITGPHEAEARILPGEDIYSPIGKGDPVYSPLWSSGRGETFSIVGIMDLDGDGKSDRDLLHEIIRTAGASIDNEVDDQGNLFVDGKIPDDLKPKITEKTKFLVIGKIPDIASTADVEEIKIIQKILDYRKQLEDAARERGVQLVSLSNFLSYMGFRSQKRLFVPGGETPYTLKAGSRSASTEETVGSRASSGQTSGAYSGDKMLKPKTSTGTTSKLFRGGAGK